MASIAVDGVSLLITDTTGSTVQNLKIESTSANAYAARDLGIEADVAAASVDGSRIIAGLNSVLVRSLNGGAGLSGNTTLDIQDRSGSSDTFTIDEDGSVSEIIAQINASGAISVTASLNDAGNGLLITDTTESTAANLMISNVAASELGIAADVAADSVRGSNLQLRYVAEGTALSQLNYGRGIGSGQFRITDGEGDQVIVDIASDSTTVFDIIREINAAASGKDVDVNARVNDTGDGILIENTLTPVPAGIIKVESISGTTAADLNILGQADVDGGDIDGSFETEITFNASDTIDEILSDINSAGIPISAAILNTGSGPTPFKIVFTSEITGTDGELVIDDEGFGMGITTLTEAQDSKVFFGSDDPAQATLIKRSSNSLDDVLPGVSIDLVSASTTPVTLTVARDTQTIDDKIGEFVTAFNDVIGRIDQYDFFDVETEERGTLLGNSTTAQVRNALFRVVQQKAIGVGTQYQYLTQVGITVGADALLEFDRDKFATAYNADPEAVENLFTAFKGSTTTTKEVEPGVTVNVSEQKFSELGFADLFDQFLDGLTDSINGSVTLADQVFQDQIDLTRDRIDDFDDRLDARRERLEREFAGMEAALARLQGQSNALFSLAGNLSLAQSLLRL